MARFRLSPGDVVRGLLGALAFVAGQIPLLLMTPAVPGGIEAPGWLLNSGRNALFIAGVLAVGAAGISLRRQSTLRDPVAYAIGAALAMAGTLFGIGAGNIFPIVIAFGTILVGVAVLVGSACGAAARALLTRAA
jgi:hypothetical protein